MNNTQNHRQDAYYEQPEQVTEEDRARIARPMTYASGSFSRVDSTRFYPGCSTEQANMSSATGPVNNHSMPRAMDSPREGVNPYPGPYSAGVSYSHTYAPPMGQNVVPGPYSAYVQPTGPNVVHGAHPMYAPGSRPPSAYTAQPFTTGPPMQAYPPSNGAPDLRRLSINGPQSPASSFPSVTQMRPSPQGPPMMQTYGTARPIRASVTSGPEIVGRPGTSGSASPSQPDEGNSKLDASKQEISCECYSHKLTVKQTLECRPNPGIFSRLERLVTPGLASAVSRPNLYRSLKHCGRSLPVRLIPIAQT